MCSHQACRETAPDHSHGGGGEAREEGEKIPHQTHPQRASTVFLPRSPTQRELMSTILP